MLTGKITVTPIRILGMEQEVKQIRYNTNRGQWGVSGEQYCVATKTDYVIDMVRTSLIMAGCMTITLKYKE